MTQQKAPQTAHNTWLYATIGKSRQGDLVSRNLRLVWSIASEFLYLNIPFEDLFQTGAEALIDAARLYRPEQGAFSSYAAPAIRRRILASAGLYAGAGRLPSDVYRHQRILRLAADRFRKENHLEPDFADLAEMTGLSEENVRLALGKFAYRNSLDDVLYDEDGCETQRTICLPDRSTERELDRASLREDMELALRRYSQRDADLFRMLFGLGTEERTLPDVASLFGLTASRVRQIRDRILRDLRSLPQIRQYVA